MLLKPAQSRFLSLFGSFALLLAIPGCAVNSPISGGERDQLTEFDGKWTFSVNEYADQQYSGNGTLRCKKRRQVFFVLIKNGKSIIYLPYGINRTRFDISIEGKFHLTRETEENRPLVVNLKGDLSETAGTGYYTIFRSPNYDKGCRYHAVFQKIEAEKSSELPPHSGEFANSEDK